MPKRDYPETEVINYNGTCRNIEDDLYLAQLTQHESRLAFAFVCLHMAFKEYRERTQQQGLRRPIDHDFIGWIAWNDGAGVPRDKQLIVRFDDGETSAPRSYDDTTYWGERADEIVAYRLA